jgi:hypothetical protein
MRYAQLDTIEIEIEKERPAARPQAFFFVHRV